METLSVALFLSIVIKSVLDYIAEPIRTKFPTLDLWWFNYLALVCGGAVSWLANMNLFATYIDVTWLGKLLTALLIGGGAKLINDVFSNAPQTIAAKREMQVTGRSLDMIEYAEVAKPKGW